MPKLTARSTKPWPRGNMERACMWGIAEVEGACPTVQGTGRVLDPPLCFDKKTIYTAKFLTYEHPVVSPLPLRGCMNILCIYCEMRCRLGRQWQRNDEIVCPWFCWRVEASLVSICSNFDLWIGIIQICSVILGNTEGKFAGRQWAALAVN